MSTTWDDYLKLSDATSTFNDCNRRCRPSFEQQRKSIERVFDATRPKTVACLGAGVLNDIPYDIMMRAGATLHLVDWMPGSIDAGIDMSIIVAGEDGHPRCIYCGPNVACPATYCRHYQSSSPNTETVCDAFVPSAEPPLRCAAFQRGDHPSVHYDDVTGGYASAFGRRILDELHQVQSWKQALARATQLAARVERHQSSLGIDDASCELVTSSMLISQFDHEPYEYFAGRAADLLGSPSANEEKRLTPAMKALRSILLTNQVERHCREIKRILSPNGRCYMSFEMFHAVPGSTNWFVVDGIPKALEIIGSHFHFNFDILPEAQTITRFQTGDAPSLVCPFVLEHSES